MADSGGPGHKDWPAVSNANNARPPRSRGRLRDYWEPLSLLAKVITALLGAVTALAGLLSALVATGIIYYRPATPARSITPTPSVSVVYTTEGLRLRLGQCFNLDTGQAQCGEEDIGLPERQTGMLAISNGAQVDQLGARTLADYNALDPIKLEGLSYSNVRIIDLAAGQLIAVKTHSGNFAKLWVSIVQTPDYTLKMTTYYVG